MSNTYGSIHIKTEQSQQIIHMILDMYIGKPNEYEELLMLTQRLNIVCEGWNSFLQRSAQEARPEFFIAVTDGWVSFYDCNMSYEDTPKSARALAKKTKEPIVYMSCFDDDIFVFGLIENGRTKTSGRACAAPDVYDITEKQAKMAEFYRVTGASMPEKRMKMPSDVMELEDLLSSIMPVPLMVYDEDAFKSLAEEYELTEEVKGIRVFKVKYRQ